MPLRLCGGGLYLEISQVEATLFICTLLCNWLPTVRMIDTTRLHQMICSLDLTMLYANAIIII